MTMYHWFGVLLAVAACYADETYNIVPELSKSYTPTFKQAIPPFPLLKYTTPVVGEEKFDLVPKLLSGTFTGNTFKTTPFTSNTFKFTPSFTPTSFQFSPSIMQGEEKFTIVPELTKKFVFPTVSPFKFTPTFMNGEETFKLVPELAKRIPISKPVIENRDFVVPSVDVKYGVPTLNYAPPPPPPAPKPVYGLPTVIKNVGSSSVTLNPVFDYTMIESLVQGMMNFKNTMGTLKPGSYQYMSADGVPVSVKIFNDFQ